MSYGDSNYNSPGGGMPSQQVNGTLILVFGILGLIICQIFAPIAWVMGNNAVKVPGAPADQVNLANIGRILGIIGTVFLILGVLWGIFFGSAMISAAMHGAASGATSSSRMQ